MKTAVKMETEKVADVCVASRITGFGMAVPERVISNDYFSSYLDTTDDWIRDRTGISERRWAEESVCASELAVPACEEAIKCAGLTVGDIDGIVLATVTPDYIFPSTACVLQKRLGIKQGFAFDVNAVCTGFIYALVMADALIQSGKGKNILVVGTELYSRLVNPDDRSTCVLFGDGAGAVVLSNAASVERGMQTQKVSSGGMVLGDAHTIRGVYGSELRADGRHTDILCTPMGTAKQPTPESLAAGEHYLTMAGREVFKLAVRSLVDISQQLVERVGLTIDDVDHIVSHQANKRILLAMGKQLHLPKEKILMNVEKYGNTSAASVPILLAENACSGRIKPGDLVLANAFGGGVTWGAILFRF